MEMAKAVHHMDEGSNLEVAKLAATEEMKDSRILIETVLGMYHTLSERTLALMRERAHRQVLTDSLIQSERRERQFSDAVMNSVPGLVFVCDVKWRLVKWNEPCEEVTGRSGEDLANRSFWSLFDQNQLKQDQLKNVQAHAESWSGVTPYEFEVRVIGAEGEVVPYLFTSHYIDLEGSRYVTAVGVDISERHSKELELSESRERYAEAQRIAGLGIWEYDHESADIYWSDELYKIYELDKASFTLSSQSIVERIHPDDQGLVNRGYRDAFSNRRPLEIEYRILAQDGHVKYVRESLAHSFIDDDRLARTVGTVMDVTRNVLEQQALEESARQIRQALQGTLSAMSKALEIKDPYTAGHQERVALLAAAIAGKLGLSEDEIEGVRIGAGIHDLGQIAIPAQILSKPGPLSDTEFSIVKTHTEVGETILSEVDFPWPVNDIIAQHHERLDGSGYPDGLVGDQICREALIVAVADVFEAMTAFRPFRASLGADAAFEELLTNRGNLYDPEVVDALVAVVEESPELATPQL
jgi:PAS domain S-box-containing protein